MIDLHLHLDGSMTPQLIKQLAIQEGVAFPEQEFESQLSVPADCESLNQYLQCFELPVAVLQSSQALTLAVKDLTARLEDQGLSYGEIRFAPSLHTRQGLTQAQVTEAAIAGLPKSSQSGQWKQFQLILCCMRGGDESANRETVETAARYLGKGVCAVDLAGAEALYPTEKYRELMEYARSLGVSYTIHAGEADGPESIWQAIQMGAQRIGHGVRAKEDPQLVTYLAGKKLPLELCPTSNLQTKAVPNLEGFPLREYLHQGLVVTVNTDNMTVSRTTLEKEFQLLTSIGLTESERKQLLFNSVEAAFLPAEEKAALKGALQRKLGSE